MRRQPENVLEIPNYAPVEVVRYFHISFDRLEYWTAGGSKHALVRLRPGRRTLISFKNLVEFYVLEGLREVHDVNMSNIRHALKYMLNHTESRHPFADYEIRTEGRDVWFLDEKGHPVNASRSGQMAIDAIVGPYLKRVLRNRKGIAQALFPFTKKEQITATTDPGNVVEIDPKRCFGEPVLVGSRITTPFLAGRFGGGESVPAIAASYGRSVAEIKEAIEWEIGKEIKAA
jgi:uncharacterized protein (DUF433 family)